MNILGVNGGNGVILFPIKKYLKGNIELRSVFHTKGDYQWKLNFKNIPIFKKIKELPDIPNIDIIISHPDCGHSSVLAYSRGKKMRDPSDNKSLNLFFQSVNNYKPKIFLMENLTAFIDNFGVDNLYFELTNYRLVFHNVSVSIFGNSQINRHRLVLIGIRRDMPKFFDSIFNNVYQVNELKKSKELIKGLREIDLNLCHIREDENDIITLYAGYKDVIKNIRNEWVTTRAEESRWKTPHKKFSTAPGVYKNLANQYPATVRPTNRQYNHRGEMMSPRELSRIQNVPSDFKLYVDPNNLKYSINKGRITVTKTPPYDIGVWFYKQLMKVKKFI